MALQDDYIRTALRLPAELHRQIHEAAAAGGRSFNAEIIGRLQGSFSSAAASNWLTGSPAAAGLLQDANGAQAGEAVRAIVAQLIANESVLLRSGAGLTLTLKIAFDCKTEP